MQPSFARNLGLYICKINVDAQKIDYSRLETFRMVVASFQVNDKDKESRFLEKTFLPTNISIDIAFRIFFLNLGNVKVHFNY